ncbi:MAG: CBS domain-containing protein [Chitinophagaceae bacterium]|nr:CBS domain-containing protein [Chitinophagaceae bacterium]MEA3425328.1 CBS domain-containing protein [Bacteroidota bacterium]MCA6453733.1 CBS domain-containing protein [Chitinophagaceae bacterium]MCA6455050.1 CBS domain-containing protein [Chitinophagaceae bacterium]MCA6458870.1 CBS domain-containing protein [Chitinophagaceae bacterium]
MLASQLINSGFPAINLFDKISLALQLMDEYDVLHLPVLSEEKYAGLISKDDLLDADEGNLVATMESSLQKVSVKGDEYFLSALRIIADHELSLLPVITAQSELSGVITARDLLRRLSSFVGNDDKGGIIVLETEKRNFSFGEVNRLVETNDAYITQLNTYTEPDTGLVVITLKVNKIEVSDIVATFQRYDYAVRYYFGEETYTNELKENYNHLLSYLNM